MGGEMLAWDMFMSEMIGIMGRQSLSLIIFWAGVAHFLWVIAFLYWCRRQPVRVFLSVRWLTQSFAFRMRNFLLRALSIFRLSSRDGRSFCLGSSSAFCCSEPFCLELFKLSGCVFFGLESMALCEFVSGDWIVDFQGPGVNSTT